jgi:hypothetical protein
MPSNVITEFNYSLIIHRVFLFKAVAPREEHSQRYLEQTAEDNNWSHETLSNGGLRKIKQTLLWGITF